MAPRMSRERIHLRSSWWREPTRGQWLCFGAAWPARSRGIISGVLQGSWAVGYLAAALVSAAVLPAWGWRGLFALAVLPALLVLPLRWWVPDGGDPVLDQPAPVPSSALLERRVL